MCLGLEEGKSCHCDVYGVYFSMVENPIWRNVCVVHIALCVIGSMYLLSYVFDLLATGTASFLVYEEAR